MEHVACLLFALPPHCIPVPKPLFMDHLPTVTSDPAESIPNFDLHERMKFWESCRPWLAERGYAMYTTRTIYDSMYETVPSLPMTPGTGGELPYAFQDECGGHHSGIEMDYYEQSLGRVVFAQDREGHHIALKLVKDSTDEQHIFDILLEEQKTRKDMMIPGILPTLDLFPFAGHWLAVMPRWGCGRSFITPDTVEDVIYQIRSLLEGLTFLHSRRIIHRDLDGRNILINHFCHNSLMPDDPSTEMMREDLMKTKKLRYAIFDFNLSILMPPDTSIERCRLPYRESWYGAYGQPPDVLQGEYDYNPFALDVGTFGILFCESFQHWTPTIPFLAPLLDGMVTRNVSARFTAADALAFLEDQYAELDDEQCHRMEPKVNWETYDSNYETHDRWTGLPPDLVRKWSHLREPKLPWTTKALRWLCRYQWAQSVVRSFRQWKNHLVGRTSY